MVDDTQLLQLRPLIHLTEHCYHRLSACSFDDLVTSQYQSHARPVLSQTALHPVRTPDRPTSTGTTVLSALGPLDGPTCFDRPAVYPALCPSARPSGGAPPIRHSARPPAYLSLDRPSGTAPPTVRPVPWLARVMCHSRRAHPTINDPPERKRSSRLRSN
jgi:hypothetical protein